MAQSVLTRLRDNINATSDDATTPLDHRLFEEAELVLADTLSADDNGSLVIALSSLLPTLQQDPTPAVNLLLRLVNDYSYADVLRLGCLPFADGLAVGEHMVSFNRLIIALLNKATKNAADAASVAGMLDVVLALVRLWLCTSDTGVASRAQSLLLGLLRVDQEARTGPEEHLPTGGGQGLIWKRIFGDRDIYRTFFDACSLSGPSSLKLSKSQRTLAQARLMEWLPLVSSMDWNATAKSHHADVERAYNVEGGLLDFAALHMVDTKDDVLMYRCLIDFLSDLLQSTKPSPQLSATATDSEGLRYTISKGLHAKVSALYTQLPGVRLGPVEETFLYGPAASYIATYASCYPHHFLASQMPLQVTQRLNKVLNMSPGRWAHQESPKHDLHLLSSIPRKALLPTMNTGWQSSPISLLPSKATNADVLNTLAVIFHGPSQTPEPDSDSATKLEASEACALYYHYLAHNPGFWHDMVTHADTVALQDLALAALHCLLSVMSARWHEDSSVSLPSTLATPSAGHLAILSPPALEYTLPYLLKPPQSFVKLVGGRGDTESSAYKIASAKFDCLSALYAAVKEQAVKTPGEGFEEMLPTLEKRVREGPFSREGEVGGRIGTLEL